VSLKNPVTPPGIDRAAQCLNRYATPGPYIRILRQKNQLRTIHMR